MTNLKTIATLGLATAALGLSACANYVPYSTSMAEARGAKTMADGKLDPNQKVCKVAPVTGSRFTQTTCFTRAQWAEMEENAKKDTNRMQEMGRIGNTGL